MTRSRPLSALLALSLLAACSGEGSSEREPAPRPVETAPRVSPSDSGSEASAARAAMATSTDPRLALFDVKTALEAARTTADAYPSPAAFRAEDRWRLQRAHLDTVFDEWEYTSDGASFELRGTLGDRAYRVSGP